MHEMNQSMPTVVLPQGTVVGIEQQETFPQVLEVFLNIPYAVPPTGDLRFRPARPVTASKGVLDASRWGPRCPSKSSAADALPESEDCLSANVFRPRARPVGVQLPVVVHVHGGGFNFGGSRARDMASLVAWSASPFIAVTFNYRLGILGFMCGGLAAREGATNLGLKDQAMLFEWVNQNIAAFGGDPGCVTLMGESAGAHSV